jgi:SAM-dependent methyltransferase
MTAQRATSHVEIRMNSNERTQSTEAYAEQAATLIARYESISFEASHRDELHLLPTSPGRALDIGAGSGRDAAWLAKRGHRVLAVEPTAAMRAGAMQLHPSSAIEWLDDALPDLTIVRSRGERFDLILISAVWMHLDDDERAAAMPLVATLLSPNGLLLLSLRHGSIPAGRRIFDVSGKETIALATQCGLQSVLNVEAQSVQAENLVAGVTWTKLAFKG